jgi:hypothetical protein
MQPRTLITIQSNALGILPPQFGSLVAMAGVCSGGTINVPQSFGTVKSLRDTLIDGPLVEAAAHAIERYGNPVLCVPVASSTPAAVGSIVKTGTGTSIVTADPASAAVDDFEVFAAFDGGPTGTGTVGTAGITLRWSLDGGRNMSAPTALGIATSFEIPGSGVTLAFAAGTLVTGDTVSTTTTAAKWDMTTLTPALAALGASTVPWDILALVGAILPTIATALDSAFEGIAARGKFRMWAASVAVPDVGQSDGAYQTALAAAWGSIAVNYGSISAGACLVPSAVSGRTYLRPFAWVFVPYLARLSEELDAAALRNGPLPCTIYDENGNLLPRCHDESITPGLDDQRFTVARSWNAYQGTYVNNPRIFSANGSDFKYCQHRRIMNIGAAVLQQYFDFRLSVGVATDTKTGKILEEDAKEMETGAVNALAAALMAKPKASGVACVVSRADNLIQTETLHVTGRIQPFGYPKAIDIDLAFQVAIAATTTAA